MATSPAQGAIQPLGLTNDTFTNSKQTGLWNNAGNWSAGLPNSNTNVLVTGSGSASFVTQDTTATIANLTIHSGDGWALEDGQSLTIKGSTISNAGLMILNSAGSDTGISLGSSAVTLTGGGTLLMSNQSVNYITEATTSTFTNQETIEGAGTVGAGSLALVNSGTINANQSGGIYIDTTTINNSGTLEAQAGSTLTIYANKLTNTAAITATSGGTVVLNGGAIDNTRGAIGTLNNPGDTAASTVSLQSGVTITGGLVGTLGIGTIAVPNGNGATLNKVTAGGNLSVGDGGILAMSGSVGGSLSSTLTLNSAGSSTSLVVGSASLTLASDATVTLSNNSQNFIYGSAGGSTLTNKGFIVGAGYIGYDPNIGAGQMALANPGTIASNQAAGLTIATSNGFTNSGTVQATIGTTLTIDNDFVGTTNTGTMEAIGGTLVLSGNDLNNTGGTIEAYNSTKPSTVSLQGGVAISGGTVGTTGTGIVTVPGGQSAALIDVTASGNFLVGDAGTLTMNGILKGNLELNSAGSNTSLFIGNAELTVAIGSTLTLSNHAQNFVYSLPTGSLLNQGTIQGAGYIGLNPNTDAPLLALANSGTINANQSQDLWIETSNGFSNSGIVEATGGVFLTVYNDMVGTTNTGIMEAASRGGLVLSGNTVNNAGGTIEATASSGVYLEGGVTIASGTLTTTGSGFVAIPSAQSANLNGVTASGSYFVGDGGSLTVSGGTTLTGSLALNSAGSNTSLVIGGSNITLPSSTTVTMSDNAQNFIYGSAAANTLTNKGTVQGAGYIGIDPNTDSAQLALANSGTIDSNQTAGLIIQVSNGITNSGTLEATAGSTLTLNGGAINNTGTIEALNAKTASTVSLESGVTITGGTLTTTGNGVIAVNGGQSATLDGLALSGHFSVADSGTVTLEGATNVKGSFTMNSSGDNTSLVIGSSHVTLTTAGTLTMSNQAQNFIYGSAAANTLTNQGVIQGAGYIGLNPNTDTPGMALVNSGTISGNQSAGLVIATSNGFTNSHIVAASNGAALIINNDTVGTTNTGVLEATTGGDLVLSGNTLNNTGGTIEALNSSKASIVTLLGGVTVTGGNLTTSGNGSVVVPSGNSAALNGVAASGAFSVGDASSLTLSGGTDLVGRLALTSNGDNTSLVIGGSNITLPGSTTVTLSGNPQNFIYASAAANTLTNRGTIQGAGYIGLDPNTDVAQMALINSGTIDSNQPAGLIIQTSNGFTNTKTVEATAGSTLTLTGNAIDNTGGTIEALNAKTTSLVVLENGTTIIGGTLTTTGNGMIETPTGQTATLSGLTVSGNYSQEDGSTTMLNGTINLTGAFALSSGGNVTSLVIGSSKVSLVGGGTLTMSNNGQNYIYANAANTLTNQVTIRGAGYIGYDPNIGTGQMALNNAGTIDADQSAGLVVETSYGFTNTGTVEATSGATLTIVNDSKGTTNSGTMEAAKASTVVLSGNKVTNNGTFEVVAGTLNLETTATLTNFSGNTLTGGTYAVYGTNGAAAMSLSLGSNNGGEITNNSANIVLAGSNASAKFEDANGNLLLSALTTNTAAGSLTVENGYNFTTGGAFTNKGTLTVGPNSRFDVGNFSNAGAVRVATGSTLTVGANGNYTQTGGTTTVDGTLATTAPGGISINSGSVFGNGGKFGGNVTSAGTLNIGDALAEAAQLSITGTYVQTGAGSLAADIGGLAAGTQYDQLDISHAATLDGTLNIDVINSFTPTVGETFDIVNASSVSCGWTVNGIVINSSEYFAESCSNGEVLLTVVSGHPSTSQTASSPAAPWANTLSTPEPGAVGLLGTALLGLAWLFRRRPAIRA